MMLSDVQVAEMVRLRIEERLTQRQIAQQLGIVLWDVTNNWKRIPERYRSRSYSCTYNGRGKKRGVQNFPALTGGRCSGCSVLFDEDNMQDAETGVCTLCVLQGQGMVVLYRDEGAGDTTRAIIRGKCHLPGRDGDGW